MNLKPFTISLKTFNLQLSILNSFDQSVSTIILGSISRMSLSIVISNIHKQSKSNLPHRPGDLSNAKLTEIRDMYQHCIQLDVPYLTSPWPVVGDLNYLVNCIIPYFHSLLTDFCFTLNHYVICIFVAFWDLFCSYCVRTYIGTHCVS